jgi:hypothetical protein
MSRRRYISTSMSIDKRLNRLAVEHSDFAALLYTWMIPHAADDTTLNGDLDEFMATVIPMRRDKHTEDVVAALEGMETLGLIVWERAENRIRFPAAAFYAHQSYIRADNRVEDWPTPQNAEERRRTPQNAVSFSLSSSVSVSAPPPNGAAPAPKRSSAKRPGIKALTDEQRERITADFADIPHLGEEIEYALNHTAHDKCRDENLYLRHWLRGTREKLPKVHGKSLDDPFAAMVVKGYDQ